MNATSRRQVLAGLASVPVAMVAQSAPREIVSEIEAELLDVASRDCERTYPNETREASLIVKHCDPMVTRGWMVKKFHPSASARGADVYVTTPLGERVLAEHRANVA